MTNTSKPSQTHHARRMTDVGGSPRIYIAIDTTDMTKARQLVASLEGADVGFKLGLEFFMAHGHDGVRHLLGTRPLFLDLKFHDIPNTVAGAVKSVAPLRPTILNVHAGGGLPMMQAAKAALDSALGETDRQYTKLIGVTVLTSMDTADLKAVGQNNVVSEQVMQLAKLTKEAGLDGIVCSAQEAASVRAELGEDFMAVTPGMRASLSPADDQKRAMSPADAIKNGSTHLVIGRLVTNAPDPAAAVRALMSGLDT